MAWEEGYVNMNRTLRIAVAGIVHETNSFAPGFTGIESFRDEWIEGREAFVQRYKGTRTTMGGVIDAAERHGAELLPGLYTSAMPSGMVLAEAADEMIDAVVGSIDDTADGLGLIMHGAMVSQQYPDLEGECLRRLRERLGRNFPLAMTLDLHANISRTMADLADVIVGYDTYPHVDMYERAVEAFDLLVRIVRGEVRPVRAYRHSGMLVVPQGMMTGEGSMKELMERAFAMETQPGVLNVTVAGGFPYSDVPDAGMSFVVTTDGDRDLAERCVNELAALAWERRETFKVSFLEPREAIQAALAEPEGPVILCEGSDNVGGGAPADATHLLAHMTDLPVRSLIVIRDPEAVREAMAAGVGGAFAMEIGGKTDDFHGKPVAVRGTVRLLFDGRFRNIGSYMTGHLVDMGRTAVVECGNLTVQLTEKRHAPRDPGDCLYSGLRPEDFHIIVVKSAVAWQTAFGQYARRVINVDSPGCCSANLRHFDYKQVRRPVYPLEPN